MIEKKQTVFVVKYALTKGIFAIEAESVNGWQYAVGSTESGCKLFLPRTEFAFTFLEAVKKARKKRVKKLASLRKQIEKIEALDFRR